MCYCIRMLHSGYVDKSFYRKVKLTNSGIIDIGTSAYVRFNANYSQLGTNIKMYKSFTLAVEKPEHDYSIGYDEDIGAITFPVRTTDGTARFIKRRLVASKRFLNETDVAKKDIVYGLYYILRAGITPTEIYLNESETDTMSSYQGGYLAGAILGRILFKEQVMELLKAGVKTVNLFFDNDKAGVECTLRSYQLLSKTPIHVNVVKYPGLRYGIDTVDATEIKYKDANDLLKAGIIKNIEVVPYMEYLIELEKSKLISPKEILENNVKK